MTTNIPWGGAPDMGAIELARLEASKQDRQNAELARADAIEAKKEAAADRYRLQIESLAKELVASEAQELYTLGGGGALALSVLASGACLGFFLMGPIGIVAGAVALAIPAALTGALGAVVGNE